jgi:lysophospholipase L1-like esterase
MKAAGIIRNLRRFFSAGLFLCVIAGAVPLCRADATIPMPEPDPARTNFWYGKHAQDTNDLATLKPEILFMGDSITDYWNSLNDYGANIWSSYYSDRNAYNIGISGDKIEGLLWRIQNGVFSNNINPKVVVLMIGTNNREDLTNRVAGIRLVIDYVLAHTMDTKVLALGIFPREVAPNTELFQPVFDQMALWPETNRVVIADIRDTFLLPGTSNLNTNLFRDGRLHPNEDGYQCEAQALETYIAGMMGETNNIFTSVGVPVIPEGGTGTYSIRLFPAPVVNETVTVARVSGDTDLNVAGSSTLIFTPANGTNWMTVTLSAAADSDTSNGSAFFRCSSPARRSVDTKVSEFDIGYALPFSETFEAGETNAGTPAAVSGQHGWVSDSPFNVVTTNEAHGGLQSLKIGSGTVRHSFNSSSNAVHISYWAMPYLSATNPPVPADASAVFWFGTNGEVSAYSNSSLVQISSSGLQTPGWNKFDVVCDYTSQAWSLDINGTNVIRDFGFYSSQSAFSEIQFISLDAPMYLDDLNISNAVYYALQVSSTAGGIVSSTGGIYKKGASVQVSATADPYYDFTGWIGALSGASNPVAVVMDSDKIIGAVFSAQLLTNSVPAWWLAQNGLATNDAGALSDTDGDGMPAWQEWIAGTVPTNGMSRFEMAAQSLQGAEKTISWSSETGRLYSVYWSPDLLSGFEVLASNLTAGIFTDTTHGAESQGFYQITVNPEP